MVNTEQNQMPPELSRNIFEGGALFILKKVSVWVYNTVALIAVVVVAILVLTPNVISGKLQCARADGTNCSNVYATTSIGGLDFEDRVRGNGSFKVPVMSRFGPQEISFQEWTPERQYITYGIVFQVDVSDIWCGVEHYVRVNEKALGHFEKPEIQRSAARNNLCALLSLVSNWVAHGNSWVRSVLAQTFVSTAHAAEVLTYKQYLELTNGIAGVHPPSGNLDAATSALIEDAVKETLDSYKSNDANSGWRFASPSEINRLNGTIAEKTGVAIAPQHWELMTSEQDVADYLKSLKANDIPFTVNPDGTPIKSWSETANDYVRQSGSALVVSPSGAWN